MKKTFGLFFVFAALLGMANCFVLEPALAAHDETTCVTPDGCDDCFICCSLTHHVIPSVKITLVRANKVSSFLESSAIPFLESPSFSIFHPPHTV